jgi:hypothetical protein
MKIDIMGVTLFDGLGSARIQVRVGSKVGELASQD